MSEDGRAGGKKGKWGSRSMGCVFAGWVRKEQREAAHFVESVLFSHWLI